MSIRSSQMLETTYNLWHTDSSSTGFFFLPGVPTQKSPIVAFSATAEQDRNMCFQFPLLILSSRALFWNWAVSPMARETILFSLSPPWRPLDPSMEINLWSDPDPLHTHKPHSHVSAFTPPPQKKVSRFSSAVSGRVSVFTAVSNNKHAAISCCIWSAHWVEFLSLGRSIICPLTW